jgi:hypothetical protein
MKWIIYGVVLLLLFVFQLAIANLNIFPSTPNLVLIYLAVLLFYIPIKDVIWLSIGVGVLLDFFSGLPDGIMVVSVVGSMLAAYYLSQMVFTEQLSTFLILFYTILSTIVFFLAVLLSNYILTAFDLGRSVNFSNLFSLKLGADVIFNLIALYPIYWIYQVQTDIQHRFYKHEPI